MAWPAGIKRPSEWREDVLLGKVAMADAPESIQSWAQFTIYHAAKEIMAQPEKGLRRNMLSRIPALIRPYVEAEVVRLWR